MKFMFDSFLTWLLLGEAATLAYIAWVAKLADLTGLALILFPELAALAYGVFSRPQGAWARAPLMLVVTPTLTAIVGILIEQHAAYGLPSVLLSVASSFVIIRVLKSPIAPALSAGLLPLVLKEGSWWYPAATLVGTAMLVTCLIPYRRTLANRAQPSGEPTITPTQVPMYAWAGFYLVFLMASVGLVELTGLRFILFPPLVVISYEMFAHSHACPCARKPLILPVVCALSAAGGVIVHQAWGNGPLAAMLAVALALLICRLFRVYVPPAAAVSLLPFVMGPATFMLPVAVGAGTLLLGLSFLLYQSLYPPTSEEDGTR